MQMKEKHIKYIFIIFLLVLPACIALTRILPFIDLPFRLMASTIFRYYDSADYLFNQYYTIPTLFKSNVFHLIFCSLKIFPDVETANKIYYIIYFVSFPVLLYFLIKKLGGNKWYSILGFFIVFNSDAHWGFADYTMSFSALLVFILVILYAFRRKNILSALLCSVVTIGTFFIHFQMAIYECALLVILSVIILKKDKKKIFLFISSIIPAFIIMGYVYMLDSNRGHEDLLNYLINYYIRVYPTELLDRLKNIFFINNFHLGTETYGVIIGISVSAIILIPAFYLTFKKKIQFKFNEFPEIIILTSVIFYFILPDKIPGQNLISSRFAEIIFLGIILYISKAKLNLKYINYLTIFLVIFFAINVDYFAGFNKVIKGYDESFFKETDGKAVLTSLIDNNSYRDRPVFVHFENYYTVWTKKISTGLTDYRYGVIRRNVTKEILPEFDPWSKFSDYPAARYTNAGYLLLKSDREINDGLFTIINSAGDWKLYKRNN